MWTTSSPKGVQNNHMAAPVKVARQQTTLELSTTFRNLPPELASRTCLRNLPTEPTQARLGTLRNLPQPTPAHTGTLRNLPELAFRTRNLPELASGTYTPAQAGTLRNLPQLVSGTYRHQHTPELSGTLRNLPEHSSEPAPATRTGAHRSLSGLKTPLAYAVGEKSSKISFGGIPNSSSVDSLTPCYMGAFLRSGFADVENVIPVIKTITWLLLSRLQGNKPHRNSPEPSESCQRAPELFGTLGTYTNTRRNFPAPSGTFRDLPEPTFRNLPEPYLRNPYPSIHRNPPISSGTFQNSTPRNLPESAILHRNSPEPSRNLPPEPTPAQTGTLWEPSGKCLRNLHQRTPELSGTFRNLPPEPARAGTLQNLAGPSSGTSSCDPRPHTPKLIWAEDPISLRCWGKS